MGSAKQLEVQGSKHSLASSKVTNCKEQQLSRAYNRLGEGGKEQIQQKGPLSQKQPSCTYPVPRGRAAAREEQCIKGMTSRVLESLQSGEWKW